MNDLEWAACNVHKWPTLPHDNECEMIFVDNKMESGWGRVWPEDHIDGSEITKAQWLAERERLQNKPKEWEGEWLFQDKHGWWHSFDDSETPMVYGVKDTENYCTSKGFLKTYAQGIVLGDWRDTLEKKPEQMQRVVTDRRVTNRGGVITVSQTVDYKPADQASPPTEEEMCSFSGPTEPKHINHRCVMTEVKQEWKQGELPPVGSRAIFHAGDYDQCCFRPQLENGMEVEIIAHYKTSAPADVAVFKFNVHDGFDLVEQATSHCFRPLKTEEEKAVEDLSRIIHQSMQNCDGDWKSYADYAAKEIYRNMYRKH